MYLRVEEIHSFLYKVKGNTYLRAEELHSF